MTNLNVEIVKSTAKAHLIQAADGRQGWIQARWLREDGTVKQETFDRAVAALESRKASQEANKAFLDGMHPLGEIAEESEKAVAVNAEWAEECTDQSGTKLVWFPRTQITNGQVPGWLIEAKAKELPTRITRQRGASFVISICDQVFIF